MTKILTHSNHYLGNDADIGLASDRLTANGSREIPVSSGVIMQPGDVHVQIAHNGVLEYANARGSSRSNIVMLSCHMSEQKAARVVELARDPYTGRAPSVYYVSKGYNRDGGVVQTSVKRNNVHYKHCLKALKPDAKWKRMNQNLEMDSGSDNEFFEIKQEGKELEFRKPIGNIANRVVMRFVNFSEPQVQCNHQVVENKMLPTPKTANSRLKERVQRRGKINNKSQRL